jgi:DNA-binding NarL/FixJ family response regulator
MNILVVDDHAPTREEMCSLIGRQEDMRIVAQSDTGEDAVAKAKQLRPDVVIMDIILPGITGIDATTAIVKALPHTKIVALSNHCGRTLVQAFLKAGGAGYVRKDRAFEELIPAIRSAREGKSFVGKCAEE